jgi:HK97 family phage portal protein
MNLLDRILYNRMKRWEPEQIASLIKATGPAPSWLSALSYPQRWALQDLSAYSAQVDTYRTLSWVQIAVATLSQTAAGTPLGVMQRQGEDTEDIINHPFEQLLDRPNPLHSRMELFETTFSYRSLSGNGYWWLNRTNENQPPAEIWPIPSNHILPVPDGNLAIRGYMFEPGGGKPKIPLETWEVVHFKKFNPINYYVGLSPIEAVGNSIIGDQAMSRWNATYFDKDNANVPGMLTFADPIPDGEWKKLKAEAKEQYGGTNRALMMLRNVGKGGVEWISTNLSQKDMEFLAGRAFNREEIYSIFAPGLFAMLSKDASLNNARSNEATFMSKAVWPLLQTTAQKITNDVLPAYGDNLVCEFEDVRVRDRQMDLSEQEQAGKVMTIAEIRERYYDLPPLGDERDDKLVAQAGNPFGSSSGPNPFADNFNGNKPPQLDSGKEEAPEDDVEEPVKARREVQPTKAQQVRDELRTWERFVVKRLKAGQQSWREFKAEFVPAALKAAIEGGLDAVSTPEGARLVFEDARRWEGYP